MVQPILSDPTAPGSLQHSDHSRRRAAQRGLDNQIMEWILAIGTPVCRQGMTFYTVLEKDLPAHLSHELREKIKNLVVVVGASGKKIVTCYRAKNAIKYLKKKPKALYKHH